MAVEAGGTAALYRLLSWLSPAYPVGAFSHSHGLEWAVQDGTVGDAASCRAWIEDVLGHGGGRQDAVLLAAAWRAASGDDAARLAEIEELAIALNPSAERLTETVSQGTAFRNTTQDAWDVEGAAPLWATAPYPVAVAVAAAGHGVPLAATLTAYLHAVASNLVSAAIRLVPLGQTDGQRIVAGLEPAIGRTAALAAGGTLEDLGGSSFRADIASMRHETQDVRLFRT